MEEIEYKLKQNNAVLIVQAISKLVEIVKSKKSALAADSNEKNNTDLNISELQLLKSKCGVEDPTVSITASHGIVLLVEDGVLSIGSTLSDLMVCLSTAKCYTGITMAIGNLLLLDLRRSLESKQAYKCPFNIQKPQHPLITVLSQNNEIWLEIFNLLQLFTNHYDDKIARNSNELLRPVFFYVMCDPTSKLRDTSRRQLWNLLALKDNKTGAKLTFEILSWIQANSKQKCLELCDFLTELSRQATKDKNIEAATATILYLTSVMHRLIKYGYDPSPCISTITELLDISSEDTHSIILIILSDTIAISPSIYLKDILRLCKLIVERQSSNSLSVKCIVASILQWLLYPSNLLSEALKLANEIILFTENNLKYGCISGHIFRNQYFKLIQFADPKVDLSVKISLMADKWQTDSKYLEDWLTQVKNAPERFLVKIFNVLSAIFIHDFSNSAITQKVLDILLKLVNKKKEVSSNVLVLLLYKLATEKSPEVQVALLKALPLMAVSKQNVLLVISTLETVKSGPLLLKTLSFELFLRLWTIEVRCFPYLQKMLGETESNWEFGVAKAHTLKEICVQRPDLHGRDMVVHLSHILNKYGDQKGSTASALAIEGITELCEAGIVDIVSTWKSISQRFIKDKRPAVIKSLCEFLSQFSNLRTTSMEHDDIKNEIIKRLWNYVSSSENTEVITAAFKALSCYEMEQMSLKLLPDMYRRNLKLPAEYAKTPVESARKPEDVLPYIPGVCWVQLLQNVEPEALDSAGNFLIDWVRTEISSYKSGVYALPDGKSEPVNYNKLPEKSIIKALGNHMYIVTVSDSKVALSTNVVKQCLRILGEAYSKPLPPLDWSFLPELTKKNAELHQGCINLVCKQILISASARKVVENYINAFKPATEKSSEMTVLFTNLSYLCKGIAPNVLRPMVINSLKYALQRSVKDNDVELFKTLAESIKNALLDENIHEANRTLLSQIIEMITEEDLTADNKEFDAFLPCITETSSKYIERLSSPSVWWETTQEKFEKAIQVRSALAAKCTDAPFIWLNECINTAAIIPSAQIYTLKNIMKVFRVHDRHSTINDWILKLMGQIQEKLTNEFKNMEEITFLCDVLLLATIVFSGCNLLCSPPEMVAITKEARLNTFPAALFTLINGTYQEIAPQIMEWLYHMTKICTEIPAIYQLAFFQSLTILRHEKAFCESSKWMKYVSVKRPIC